MTRETPSLLKFSPRLTVLPVIHGSGDFAVEVRRRMLSETYDCLAVPLPPSFQADVEEAIETLPSIGVVLQREPVAWSGRDDEEAGRWTPESEREGEPEGNRGASYVPIDPCQPVIAALRLAREERIPRRFIDLETAVFEPSARVLPDPYSLKKTGWEMFAAAVLPFSHRPRSTQLVARARTMSRRLRELEQQHESVLCLCSFDEWPVLRQEYLQGGESLEDDTVETTERLAPTENSLLFLLGELPCITGL